tara:strand:- start:516 stop:1085 length:570 start_codon:yes stop_codon:yes gene_type:complete
MKTFTLPMFVVLIGTLGTQYVHGDNPADPFIGTWVLETLQNGNEAPKDFTNTKEPRQVLMITGPHVLFGKLDPSTNKFLEVRQCGKLIHVEQSKSFEEHVECGDRSLIGKVFPFTLKLSGKEQMIKERNLSSGLVQKQVLARFKPTPENNKQDGSTLGDKLIGLKKAYDAGALTEREYQQEKAKLLNQK